VSGFFFRLLAPRPDFASTMDEAERAGMDAHVAYWRDLAARGSAVAFGPVADPAASYGIAVVVAPNLDAAEALRDGDPALRIGFRTEILPMRALVTREGRLDAPAPSASGASG
jgi:uncharacterized protein YciI